MHCMRFPGVNVRYLCQKKNRFQYVRILQKIEYVRYAWLDVKLKAKARDSYIARLTGKPDQPRFTISWQLIRKSQWCCSARCGRPLHVLTNKWTRAAASEHTTAQSTTPGLHPVSIHQMAPPERTSDCSLLLIYRPRKDERLSSISQSINQENFNAAKIAISYKLA